MKETTTINISGIVFHIDQDAFALLQDYITELKKRFGQSDESKEIIHDIELRIAEILQETLTDKKQVVNQEDIEQIIETMGHPEDIESEEEIYEEKSFNYHRNKRLYRDTDNLVLGGVCSGLGHYFGLDPVIIRLLTVVFTAFYGIGLLIYIVMWAFIPKAETASQKLEMKGKPINAENIKKTVTGNYEDLKNSKGFQKARESVNGGVSAIGDIIKFILKAFVVIIGISLLIGAVVTVVSLVNVFIFHAPNIYIDGELHGMFYPMLEGFFQSEITMLIFVLSIILLSLIPILLVLFIAVKLVFKFNTNNKIIGLTALVLWLIALGSVISISISMGMSFANEAESQEQHQLEMPANKTMYIALKDVNLDFEESWGSIKIAHDIESNQSYIYDRPDFDIKRSNSGVFELEIQKSARSRDYKSAVAIAENTRYQFEQKDSVLLLNPWYVVDFKHAGRIDDVNITLYVPDGSSVFFYQEIYPIVDDIKNINNTLDYDMMNRKWIMRPEGLTPVN